MTRRAVVRTYFASPRSAHSTSSTSGRTGHCSISEPLRTAGGGSARRQPADRRRVRASRAFWFLVVCAAPEHATGPHPAKDHLFSLAMCTSALILREGGHTSYPSGLRAR